MQGLADVFGIDSEVKVAVQAGEYRIRGSLNSIDYTGTMRLAGEKPLDSATTMGVIGVRADFSTTARVVGRYGETGRPAATVNRFGKGVSVFIGACPGLAYLKEAKFVPDQLAEKYPAKERGIINAVADRRGVPRLVELSYPVVEAGVCDTPDATALVLANFTYEPIEKLVVRLPITARAKSIRSVENGPLDFSLEKSPERYADAGFQWMAVFNLELGLNDIVLVE